MEEREALENETALVPQKAQGIEIADQVGLDYAVDMLKSIKGLQKQINETFDPIVKAAHLAHKEAKSQKSKVEAPLKEAEGIIKPKIAAYNAELEKQRRAEEDRIRQEQEERERKAREEAEKAEEEARLKVAAEAEEVGMSEEEVDEILDHALPVEVAPVQPVAPAPAPVPKMSGVSTRKKWLYRITDATAIPREYLMIDEKKIGGVVRAAKGAVIIPGVEPYSEDVVSARAF